MIDEGKPEAFYGAAVKAFLDVEFVS